MKFVLFLFLLFVFSVPVLTQPKPSAKKATAARSSAVQSNVAKKPVSKAAAKKDEKAELEKALAIEDADQKIGALTKFLNDFPKGESRPQALESLTSARIIAAQSKAEAGERDAALRLLRKVLEEAPMPYPEKLFSDSISKVPMLIYSAGGAAAAYEAAAVIEKNLTPNAGQLVTLANFYLNLENGAEAKRLAEAALKIDEKSAAAYLALGMANRVNFDLEASTAAYEKAVELDPESISARQSLAEMKRATGKADEAVAIFSSLLEKDPNDLRSLNGRILALFDAGKRADAEAEFAKAIEAESANFILLSGVASWYAANGEHAKAIDLAGKAVAAEPRYIWSHIALARGLSAAGRHTDAEQVLLKARPYGNFPTLDYELATTKFNSGFYREAADELRKSFSIKDGNVATKLGRRIERSEKNFVDLLSAERRAGILAPNAADSLETAQKMKALVEFMAAVDERSTDATRVADVATAFADGTDKMRFHRQIFAANQLSERSLAPAKVLELTRAAVSSVDDGLSVPSPAAPIMASELYATRTSAIASDKYVLVPEVPKQTLSAIARGRIEELAGIALMQQKNNAEAIVRFRRAVSILPEKSAWWRSTHWRLGTALEADGKDKEALEAYVKSYTSGDPDGERYAAIEALFKRVHSGTDGLETLIGSNPAKPAEKTSENAAPAKTAEVKTEAPADSKTNGTSEVKAEVSAEKKAETTDAKPVETSAAVPKESEVPKVTESPSPSPETKPAAEESAPEQKRTETSAKPVETVQKQAEDKSKAVEEPQAKQIEKDAPPLQKPDERKVETIESKPAIPGEPPTTPPKTEDSKPEVKVAEENKTEIKTLETRTVDSKSEVKASETKAEDQKTEVAPPDTKLEEKRPDAKRPDPKPDQKVGSATSPKLLFEPVVIEVKSNKPAKTAATTAEVPAPKNESIGNSSGEGRARVVVGKDIAADLGGPRCSLTVSQSNVSLSKGKGSIGILVGADGGDVKEVIASSESPKDVDVAPDPSLIGVSGQTLYVIRSLTEAVGMYKVDFASPCGKKQVQVRIR